MSMKALISKQKLEEKKTYIQLKATFAALIKIFLSCPDHYIIYHSPGLIFPRLPPLNTMQLSSTTASATQ